jgi:hypothetical protein
MHKLQAGIGQCHTVVLQPAAKHPVNLQQQQQPANSIDKHHLCWPALCKHS